MKNTFEAKRNILKGSTDDCIAFGVSMAALFNCLNIPYISKPMFFFFMFLWLHITFVQIRHKLHKNKIEKHKKLLNSIQA